MRISFVVLLFGCGATPHTSSSVNPGILITTQQTCPEGHDCDILDVVDIHTTATSEDKGFDELRARAAQQGGDAVVGAEFEHGDHGEPSHLSGVIVRYGRPVRRHVDVGIVDIPSDEKDENKGLAELSRRAQEMGGDQVIDVTFEHGDDGQQGHLRGKVIRYTE